MTTQPRDQIAHFHFNSINPNYQAEVWRLPTVLKAREQVQHHGQLAANGGLVPELVIGDRSIFQSLLDIQAANEPIPIEQVNSIHIRDSDPNYPWLLLNIK